MVSLSTEMSRSTCAFLAAEPPWPEMHRDMPEPAQGNLTLDSRLHVSRSTGNDETLSSPEVTFGRSRGMLLGA
jgi:hypothetical protein